MGRERRLVLQGNVDYKWIITISKEYQNGIGNIKYKRLFYLCLSFFPSFFVKCFALNALKIQPNQIQRKVFRAPMRFLHYSTVSNVNAAGDQGIACNFSGIIVRASSITFFPT